MSVLVALFVVGFVLALCGALFALLLAPVYRYLRDLEK